MSYSCNYCNDEFKTEDKLHTHVLMNHRGEASQDGYEFNSPISSGYLEEKEVPKGEEFGYRR